MTYRKTSVLFYKMAKQPCPIPVHCFRMSPKLRAFIASQPNHCRRYNSSFFFIENFCIDNNLKMFKWNKIIIKDLEDFVKLSGETGFIYVSMGSSVKAANMPDHLRRMLVQTFAQLPYQVLWKWEGNASYMLDLSSNIKLSRWLPQQDILGMLYTIKDYAFWNENWFIWDRVFLMLNYDIIAQHFFCEILIQTIVVLFVQIYQQP